MAVLIFPDCKVHWTQLCFLYRVLVQRDNFIFFLGEICNISEPILKYACNYALGWRKTRIFFQERHANTNVCVLGIVATSFASPLRLISLSSPNLPRVYYSPKERA